MVYAVCLFLHLCICLAVFLCMRAKLLRVHKYMFFVALLLPFWGVLILLILHYQIGIDEEKKKIDVEKLKLESELYKSVTIDEKRIAATTVPIEEALIVNSVRERRAIIMDVLNDNPREYIEFLQKAGNNEDTEVVHYAVTALVEISKENEFTLQKFEKAHAEDPTDISVLTEYTRFLWYCLDQKLMQGQVEVMYRELLSTLLLEKIELYPEIKDFEHLITNEIVRGNHTFAGEVLDRMGSMYSSEEEYYIQKINYLATLGRGKDIQKVLDEVQENNVYLSSKAKEVLAFWEK